jgi:hypothetical protein
MHYTIVVVSTDIEMHAWDKPVCRFFYFLFLKEKIFHTYSLMKGLRAKALTNRVKSSEANHSWSYGVTDVKRYIHYNITIKACQ